jgi:DNA-binding CsgD family transcriptional regulator
MLRGRGAELSRALAVLRRTARSGRGAVLSIEGEPGIGKTALLGAVAEQARRMGYLVGAGKAEEIDQIAPGAPLLVALRSGPRPLLDAKAFAELAQLYGRQVWLVDQIAGLIEERALDAPVLIGLDDLQWADPLTRFALRILPARLAGSAVVWLVTSRATPRDAVQQLVSGVVDPLDVERILLDPLSSATIEELSLDHLGARPVGRVAEMLRGVGGNPFWAVELLDAVARQRRSGGSGDELPVEVILGARRRTELLPAELLRLLRLCAVWGRAVSVDDAASLLGGLPVAGVLDTAQRGVTEGFLRRDGRALSFRHDLLREAVYADLGRDDRLALHRACGRHLLATGGTALTAAPHFQADAAIGDREVVDVLRAAAVEAAESMPDVAADLARQAFALTGPEEGRRLEVGEESAGLLIRVHRGRTALETVDALLPGATDADARARLQILAIRALWAMNRLGGIARRADEVLETSGLSASMRTRITAARSLAFVRVGTSEEAAALASASLEEARRTGDAPAARFSLLTLSVVAKQEGRHEIAYRRIRSLRESAGAEYLAEEVRCLQLLDRYDDAADLLARAGADLPEGVDPATPDLVHAQMWQDVNLGRLDEAEAQAQTLLRLSDELGEHVSTLDASSVLSFMALVRGDFALARERLGRNSRPDADDATIRSTALNLMDGWISLLEGDIAACLALYRPLLATARTSREYWPWFPLWMRPFTQAGLAAGDRAFAAEAAELAGTGAERNPGVASFEGLALQTRGLVEGDPGLLGQAVEVLRGGPRPLLLASALADHGGALRAAGESEEAAAQLDAARRIYDRVGVALPGAPTDPAVQSARTVKRRARPQFGWDALTDAELKVAELIGAGHTNRSAAAELGTSVNTVGTHLRAVFAKLDVRSRVQLANAMRTRS